MLERRARQRSGLSDFGGGAYRTGLDRLCASADRDANLSLIGRLGMRNAIMRALVTRLRRVAMVAAHPEFERRPLRAPILLLGARSGTTFFHRLLSRDPTLRTLALWEVLEPIAGSGPDRRVRDAQRQVDTIKRVAPDIDAKHRIGVEQPEEDIFVLDSTLKSAGFYMLAPVFGYAEWLLEQDLSEAYREYAQLLRLLAASSPQRRLVLKAPAHMMALEALVVAIPDLLVVQIHRDPSTVLASMNSLMFSMHSVVCREQEPKRLGAFNARLLEEMLDRSRQALGALPAERVCHVRYDDLVADSFAETRRVYAHLGLERPASAIHRQAEFVQQRRQQKFGKHEYALEDFDLDRAEIGRRFASHREHLDLS